MFLMIISKEVRAHEYMLDIFQALICMEGAFKNQGFGVHILLCVLAKARDLKSVSFLPSLMSDPSSQGKFCHKKKSLILHLVDFV